MPAQNTQVQNPSQIQTNPNPNPKELVIKLWQKYEEKILAELSNRIDEIIEKRKDVDITKKLTSIYVLAKLDMYNNELENSISFNKNDVENVIKQGWTIDDIVCKYNEVDTFFNTIMVECYVPNDNRFYFNIMLKKVSDLSKDEFIMYSMLRNSVLLEKYEKIIEKMEKELDECREKLEEYENQYDDP